MEGLFTVRTVCNNWNTLLNGTHQQRRGRSVLYYLHNVLRPSVPSSWEEGGAWSFFQTGRGPTCVAMSAFASRHQKKDATAPAWIAVMMVRTSEPWAKIEPVVKSWRMHVII